MGMRFREIDISDVNDTSQKSAFLRNEDINLSNLYEINTLASISAERSDSMVVDSDANHPAVDESVKVISRSNMKRLAVAVGRSINMFSVEIETDYLLTQECPDNLDILDMCWIGSSDYLAAYLSDMSIVIFSAAVGGALFTMDVSNGNLQPGSGKLTALVTNGTCRIVFNNENGCSGFVDILNFTAMTDCNESRNTTSMAECVESKIVHWRCPVPISDAHIIDSSLHLIAVSERMSLTNIVDMSCGDVRLSDWDAAEFGYKFIRSSIVDGGRYFIGVTEHGVLVIRDLFLWITLSEVSLLLNKGDCCIDFLVKDNMLFSSASPFIALLISNSTETRLIVRNISTMELLYSTGVRPGSSLVYSALDRVMLLVEPFSKNVSCWDDSVRIREVCEANPEARLLTLIARKMFDEAESFAKQFGIDLQRVFTAKMDYLLEVAQLEGSKSAVDNLVSSLKFVDDHDLVGETCFTAATTLSEYEQIADVLSFARRRAVTDPVTYQRLQRVSFVLTSYRLCCGTDAAFSQESYWPSFLEGLDGSGEWFNLFSLFITNGAIESARVIWSRHNQFISERLCDRAEDNSFSQISQMLENFTTGIYQDITCWKSAISFLDTELIPEVIKVSTSASDVFPALVEFLIKIAGVLEKYEPEAFPDNSLHVVTTFDRVKSCIVKKAITPGQQALLAFMCQLMCSVDSKVCETEKYARALIEIKRLKFVYDCSLKYDDYVILNAETICYRILSKSLENPVMVSTNVQKYARPYMIEHRLDPDLTLYKYIEEISTHFKGVVSAGNPWDEQCLLVVDTINVPHLKCKAVIMIAKGAFPPWNRKLSDAVQNVMSNTATDPELVTEMESVCRRAQMGLILLKYGVQLGLLDSITASSSHFTGFLNFLLRGKLLVSSDEERLNDALKLNSLYREIVPLNEAFLESSVYALYCSYVEKTSSTADVIDFVSTLPANEPRTIHIIKHIIQKLMIDVDLKVRLQNEAAIKERLNALQTVQSLIMRFFSNDADMLKLYDLLAAALTLQTKFKLWVTSDELNDFTYKKRLFLEFLRTANCAANEIYCFSDALALDRDDACRITVDTSATSGDPISCSVLVRDALSSVSKPSQKLVISCLGACSSILECLARASESLNGQYDEQVAIEIVPQSTSIVYDLSRTMKQLILFTDFSESLHEKALRICGFLDLFMAIISQCRSAETGEDNVQPLPASSHIVGMSRRVGVYQLTSEGPILNEFRTIPLLCICARSVCTDISSLRPDDRQSFTEKQNHNWNALLNDLMLENQDLLALSISVYAMYLSCGFVGSNLYHFARNLCEKVVQTHPCDLWQLSSIVFGLPVKLIDKLLLHLKTFVSSKKSPQTMINFLRLAQFVMFHCGRRDNESALVETFSKYLWAKQLGKAGVTPGVVKMRCEDAVKQFVKAKLDPSVVNQYIDNYGGPKEGEVHMLKYAIWLVCEASDSKCSLRATELLETAEDAIRCCGNLDRERAFNFFHCLLYMICPYKYEVIGFVISCLDKFAVGDSEKQNFVTDCKVIHNFVRKESKVKSACKEEINWYIDHQKLVDFAKREPGCQRDLLYQPYGLTVEQSYTSGTNDEETRNTEMLYQRENLLSSSIPVHASGLLPFHIFLWKTKANIESVLKPIVEYEMNTSNVLRWQTVVRQVSWLSRSQVFNRSYMLSTSIEKHIKEISSRGPDSDLSMSNMRHISSLFSQYSRESVTSCVYYCYSKIPLGLAKISILKLGLHAAHDWILKEEVNSEERRSVEDHISRLQEAINRYRTELLLNKASLYDAKTSDLVSQDCSQLICYLYSTIDWSDHLSIERVTRVIKELSDIHDINSLFTIHEKLVMQWLPEVDGDANDDFAVDMNDTMGGEINVDSSSGTSIDSGSYIMPVFDNSITRIVHLLSLIRLECEENPLLKPEETDLVVRIANYVNPKTAASAIRGGFKTRIRAACVLIRSYSSTALEEHKLSQDNLCIYLEKLCVARLIDLAGLEIKANALSGKDSAHICKTLLSNQRNSSELCHLVACTVIDHLICDKQLIEDLMNKLSMARKREMLMSLLLSIRDKESLCIPNLASFWARTFDQEFSSLDSRSVTYSDDVKSLMYFLLSCPVEARGAYDSIQNYLKTKGFPFASALVGVVADSTKPSNAASVQRSVRDPKFDWCNAGDATVNSSSGIAAEAMEEDDLFAGDDTMLNF